MDKLSEWINQTVEQGNDRPIQIKSLSQTQKGQKSNSKNNNQTAQSGKISKFKKTMTKRNQAHKAPAQKQKSIFKTRKVTNAQKPNRAQNKNHKPTKKVANKNNSTKPQAVPKAPKSKSPALKAFKGLRVIPLGGLDEVGKNMTAYEYNRTGRPQDKEIVVVDMGFQFPEDDMLGVDYVIPDAAYLEENRKNIKAIVVTHGHLDHIGGIPYILPNIGFPPIYATKLTTELIHKRLDEFKLTNQARVHAIDPSKPIKIGSFMIDFFRVAHSIPDATGVSLTTPEGSVVYTGDFKFDDAPAGLQPKQDVEKMKRIGQKGVLALLSDSTNSLKPGHTMSESEIGPNIEKFIAQAKGRIIIASFSSLIGRIQQIFEYAEKYNRKIYISGRSIKDNIDIGLKLGLIKLKTSQIQDIKKLKNSTDDNVLILTTGAQGESMSALTRMAINDHPHVKIKQGDTVIISSSPIVGNERAIYSVVNNLCIRGANVIHNQISDIHTSGHAYQEELVQMMNLMKPKYFVPVHGEYFMRQAHKELAIKNGIPPQNILLTRNGGVLEFANGQAKISPQKVQANYILIDGLGQGDMGSRVLSERQALAQNGVLMTIITIDKKTKQLKEEPNILSRGFMYMHEYDQVTKELAKLIGTSYRTFIAKKSKSIDRKEIKYHIQGIAQRYVHQKLERRPLIVPIIFEK
jgi:ribonuclease J